MSYRFLPFLSCLALLCLASPSHSPARTQVKGTSPSPVQPSPAAAQFAYGGDAAEIPAEFIGNITFLPVRLNQSRPSFFVLDSTAAVSSIDPQRAAELGVAAGQPAVLNLNGVDLSLANLSVTAKTDFASQVGRAYEGTLGNDFFQRVVVEIDYGRHTVRLYDPSTYKYSGGGTAVRLVFGAGAPIAPAKFTEPRGKVLEAMFSVNTTIDASAVISDRYAEAHHLFGSHWKTIPTFDPELNGTESAVLGRLKSFQLGRFAADDPVVTFSRSDFPGVSDTRVAGEIGAGMLARYKVVFDYPHQQMIVEPNSHFQNEEEEDKSGISVVAKGRDLRTFEIVQVEAGSPAARAGIQKGDIISGIDQDAAADLSLAEIRDLFRQIGHKYTLTIERKGQSQQITIEMQRLL
jgi:PDZ domain-containing protein